MRKQEAIDLLGGTPHKAAAALGVTYQAVAKWPDPLTQRVADRVSGAVWRIHNGSPIKVARARAKALAAVQSVDTDLGVAKAA